MLFTGTENKNGDVLLRYKVEDSDWPHHPEVLLFLRSEWEHHFEKVKFNRGGDSEYLLTNYR